MNWTIRMSPEAVQSLYQIPRGPAADVTAAIRRLAVTPTPFAAIDSGLPNTYLLPVSDYIIGYEVVHGNKVIKILWIGE